VDRMFTGLHHTRPNTEIFEHRVFAVNETYHTINYPSGSTMHLQYYYTQ